MKNKFAPLGWTVEDWMKMRARMAVGITVDDVRLMRKDVKPNDEEDDDRVAVDPDDEEDDDREAVDPDDEEDDDRAKADDDQDDADEAKERMDDLYVMRGYSIRRFRDGGIATLRRVALHEAGHCVVAAAQGRRIESVTVVPGDDYAGKMSEVETPEMMKALLDFLSGGRATAEVEARARAHVVGYMAGTVAEWLMCPRESWTSDRHRTASSDLKFARLFATAIAGDDSEVLLTTARTEARAILLANRHLVSAIADALIEKGTLTGDEVDEIIDGVQVT